MVVPVYINDEVIGFLCCINELFTRFHDVDRLLIREISELASISMRKIGEPRHDIVSTVQAEDLVIGVDKELSAKEFEVARLIQKGLANKEIASALGVSYSAISYHVTNINKKLGLSSRTEIARWAWEKDNELH
jgi:DNA-binding NarL/FixJ family response regulator